MANNNKTLVYQLYPLSWDRLAADQPEDGWEKNAIRLMEAHLNRIRALEVDYVWLSPFYPSPRYDHGYDISDYKNVDPRLGTLADLASFISTAHRLGLKVIFDLVLNHTSTEHKWFTEHPEYYCWSDHDNQGWQNLFNGGSAWEYLPEVGRYYLHLFHSHQADLNWFVGGKINQDLAYEFRDIVEYWHELFHVDGFRLDVPQALNKNFNARYLEFSDLLMGDRDAEVINAIFAHHQDLFLMLECFDPTFGEVIDYYAAHTPANFIINAMLKDEIGTGSTKEIERFEGLLDQMVAHDHFMLELESHDAPRFPSRSHLPAQTVITHMFKSNPKGICLYQGQELGLKNPTHSQLPDNLMCELDAQTEMRLRSGMSLAELRPTSRANARVPIPLDEYARQEEHTVSCLNLTKTWIKDWRRTKRLKNQG